MLTYLKLIPLVGRQVQLQGTEGSLSKKTYKQLTGPGKQHSTVFTIARTNSFGKAVLHGECLL